MIVRFYNIQGFRGDYEYKIDDFVTIINSKHNGVGKTTLFDCLRFLCDSTQVDKEEQAFFLNLNETEGLFSVTVKEVTHGFVLYKDSPPVFFRHVDGEELERSSENFVTASQDVGILAINDALLNIFSKEVDLFSSSHSGKNYQLVKEITTHQQTEETLDLLERSININQAELSNLRAEKRGIDAQVQAAPYYFYVDQLEALLNNNFYEDVEATLDSTLESLAKIKEVEDLNFNTGLAHLFRLEDSLYNMQPTDFEVPSAKPLESVIELSESLDRMQVIDSVELPVKPLEAIMAISESLDKLTPTSESIELNLKPIEQLNSLMQQLNSIQPDYNLQVSSKLPGLLSSICVKLGQMTTACNQEIMFNRLIQDRRSKLSSKRVCCPIREEVYLINGKCVY